MVEASPLLVGGVAAALLLASIRRAFFRIAIAAAAVAAIAMIVESGQLLSAAVAGAILAICFAAGEAVRRGLGLPDMPPPYRVAISLPLGIALVAGAVFLLGALRILFPAVIAAVLIAGTAVSLFFLRRAGPPIPDPPRKKGRRLRRPERFPERFFLGTMIGLVLFLQLPGALAPETRPDALNYHLPVPRAWLSAHALVSLPYWHAHLAHLAETFFVAPMAFAGEGAVKLVIYGVGIVLLVAAWALGDELFGRRAAAWTAALLATIPILAGLSGETQADTLVALLLTAAFLSLTALSRLPEPPARAAVAFGLLAGGAVGTKLNAAYAVIPLAAALFLLGVRHRVSRRTAAVGLGAMALAPLAWFAMTYRYTGNPVFPFLNGWFRSPLADPANRVMNANMFGIGTSPSAWVRLPFAFTFGTHRFGENLADGVAGVALLLLPALLAVPKGRIGWRHGLAAAVVLAYGIGLGFTFQYARYFTAVLALAAALAAGAAISLSPGIARRVAITAVGAGIVLQAWMFARESDARNDSRWTFAFGEISAEQYRRRAIPGLPCVRELDRQASGLDRIAEFQATPLHYFLSAPVDSVSDSRAFRSETLELSGDRLRSALWNRHDRFILMRPGGRWTPTFAEPAFLDRFTEPVCREEGVRAFRLLAPGVERQP